MEITAKAIQEVAVNNDVLFTETPIGGNCSIVHRDGSGLVTLRGLTRQCQARFRVSFGANIAVPPGGIVAPLALAIAIDGEPVATTAMASFPVDIDQYNNVFASIFINVPRGCCSRISVKNVGTAPVNVQGANLIIERVA